MQVILYTTHCPRCKVLETKLKQKNIQYIECMDIDTMLGLGIKTAPMLMVDSELLDFSDAIKWINSLEAQK